MTKLSIVHPLLRMGGGESVCMHLIEEFQEECDIELLTVNDFDTDIYNEFFGLDIDASTIDHQKVPHKEISSLLQNNLSHRTFECAVRRLIKRKIDDTDFVICTQNELAAGSDSIEYIHFPQLNIANTYNKSDIDSKKYFRLKLKDVYRNNLIGYSKDAFCKGNIIANSEWTAKYVKMVHDLNPTIIYPPVNTAQFSEKLNWSEREDGFVLVGRITRSKSVLDAIDIISNVNSEENDIHLHIVGPPGNNEEYINKVKTKANERDFIEYNGKVDRDRLINILCTHKFGIHCMPMEHFGIAIAEMVAAGMVPIIPKGGGQREIVDNQDELMYTSNDEAIEKIEGLLVDENRVQTVRENLDGRQHLFSKNNFQKEVRELVPLN